MARNARMKKEIDVENQTVKIIFSSGDSIACALSDLSEEMQVRSALHGISQKLGDAGALGKDALDADIQTSVTDQLERLKNKEWATRKAGEPRIALVVMALARVQGVEEADAREVFQNLNDEQKIQVRGLQTIKTAMAEIKLENEQKKSAGEEDGDTLANLGFASEG